MMSASNRATGHHTKEGNMSKDQAGFIEELRGTVAAEVSDIKRVTLALAACRAALDKFHGLGGADEWQPGSTVRFEAPVEYVLWVIAYGQLLSLVGGDTRIGVGLEAVLGAGSPFGPVVADVANADDPTE